MKGKRGTAKVSQGGRGKWKAQPVKLSKPIEGYFNSVAALSDLLSQINGRNTSAQDFVPFRDRVREKLVELRAWEQRKKHRKKPPNARSLKLFAARKLADRRNISIQDALKIVSQYGLNPPDNINAASCHTGSRSVADIFQ
jgi:hypothetical protein